MNVDMKMMITTLKLQGLSRRGAIEEVKERMKYTKENEAGIRELQVDVLRYLEAATDEEYRTLQKVDAWEV